MEDNLQVQQEYTQDNQPDTQVDQSVNNQEAQVSSDQNLHQDTQVDHRPTPQESFQELRTRAEQAERERNEAVGFIRQLEQYAMQQQQQQPQQHYQAPVEERSPSYDDDDIIEGRHLKAEFSNLKKELMEQRRQMEEARRITETNTIENKLRTKYNDFDSVVTHENIQRLRELKPEIAASLHQTQNLFDKAAATYTILKDLGIARAKTPQFEQQKAQVNVNKPKSASSLSATSPLTHASAFSSGDLTEDRKRQIWESMQQNARRH